MERIDQNVQIVGACDTSSAQATQNGAAKAKESLRPIDWFAVAEQSMVLSQLLAAHRGKLNGTNL